MENISRRGFLGLAALVALSPRVVLGKEIPPEIKKKYSLTKEFAVEEFLWKYLSRVCRFDRTFRGKAKKAGGIKNLHKKYCGAHILVLDEAFGIGNMGFDKLTMEFIRRIDDGSAVNYHDDRVVRAMRNWIETKYSFFDRLSKAPDPHHSGREGFRELMHHAFDSKSMGDYLRKQHKANEELYDAMHDTLRWYEKPFSPLGPKSIIRIETHRVYEGLRKWLN